MSQQTKCDTFVIQTLSLMAKNVRRIRLGAFVIIERHPIASKTDSVRQFVDVV